MQIVNALDVGLATSISYAFRGQSDSQWQLEPSLLRHLKNRNLSEEESLQIEKNALDDFRSQAHLYLSPTEQSATVDTVSWWTVMQHHGAPTRLLDWSLSIYVAAYFAVTDNLDKDGAIWLVHIHSVNEKMKELFKNTSIPKTEAEIQEKLLKPDAPNEIQFFSRMRKSERMVAQQGLFSVCRNINKSHSYILNEIFHRYHHSR